jgi:arylsulfatase A-like enzyme
MRRHPANAFEMKTLVVDILIASLLTACAAVCKENGASTDILFLLADDLGYGETGCYGQQIIQTPVIDGLAGKGMRFTDFYAGTSVCSPSRAVLMTGKHAGHSTIRGNNGYFPDHIWNRVPLSEDDITLGEMLQQAGYQTAFIGKWHLDDPNDVSTWAMNRGFDFAVQEQWSSRFGGRSFDPLVHWVNSEWDSIRYDQDQYDCIDEFRTDFALDYLEKMDPDKPFFLFMSYRIPHAHERYTRNRELYAGMGWSETERRHAARITLLDRQIGRLLYKLERLGRLGHTVVFFSSDNGPHHEGGHDHLFFNSSGGFRGYKRDLYEGGIRIPMIAVWEGRINPGTRSGHPAAFQDFMPTLAGIAGIDPPENTDGISFLPELLGEEQQQHDYLYWELQLDGWGRPLPDGGFRQAVRMGDWKAVRYGIKQPTELYNLADDPFETRNLAAQNPDLTGKMEKLFREARTETEGFPYGGRIQERPAREMIK